MDRGDLWLANEFHGLSDDDLEKLRRSSPPSYAKLCKQEQERRAALSARGGTE